MPTSALRDIIGGPRRTPVKYPAVADCGQHGKGVINHRDDCMAPNVEGAVTRARDSARPAARRPGPWVRAGAVSVLRRHQQRLRDGERVRFCTNCLALG